MDTGVGLRCCSPHDMLTPLQLATTQGSQDIMRLLLPHCDVVYVPPYVLEARLEAGVYSSAVVRTPWSGPSALQIAMNSAEGLLQMLQCSPVPPAAVRSHLGPIMTVLQRCDAETYRSLFGVGAGYHSAAAGALHALLELPNERAAFALLGTLTRCVHLCPAGACLLRPCRPASRIWLGACEAAAAGQGTGSLQAAGFFLLVCFGKRPL